MLHERGRRSINENRNVCGWPQRTILLALSGRRRGMTIASPSALFAFVAVRSIMHSDEKWVEMRPPAVLSVGITGHRSIGREGPIARAIAETFDELFLRLAHGLRTAIAQDRSFFSDATPVLRLLGMAAEGADLLSARSAQSAGAEIGCVLPFPFEEYRNDFESVSSRKLAEAVIAGAAATFVLPGTRTEGARAYERANEMILSNVDIMIAVWDGERAKGRAGTGDVVQAAIARGTPVIIISPDRPEKLRLLAPPRDQELENPIATDLVATTLDDDLTALVGEIVLPPRGSIARQGLADLVREPSKWRTIRLEYPLLLGIFNARRGPPDESSGARSKSTDRRAVFSSKAERVFVLQACMSRVDHLANRYGLMFRSSTTSGFLAIIVAALVSSLSMVAFPSVTGASIVAQLAVNALVLGDEHFRDKWRWHERWLDYRLIAEGLRCLRFLHPLGLGLERMHAPGLGRDRSWVEWYTRRMERGLGPPAGAMEISAVADSWRRLVDEEIPDQLEYHRRTFTQLGALERHLNGAALIALYLTFAVATVFGIWAYVSHGFEAVTWRPFAIIILFVLPAATTAFNGLRADADLFRLVERSAITITALARLRRAAHSTSPNYDRIAVIAKKVAAIMGEELTEWRFVLESRRTRNRHRNILGRARFNGKLRRFLSGLGIR
jgi:hypothetical protein